LADPLLNWEEPHGRGASFDAKRGLESRPNSDNAGSFILWVQPLIPALVIWVSLLVRFELSAWLAVSLFLAQLIILVAAAKVDRKVLSRRGFTTFEHPSSMLAGILPFAYLWKRSRMYVGRDPNAARPFIRHVFMVVLAGFAVLIGGIWGPAIQYLISV